jgi:transposase
MVTVETIGKVRRAYWVQGKKIKAIARETGLARWTVRRIVRSGATDRVYERTAQPLPKLGAFVERLEALLVENGQRPKRERLTTKRLFEALQKEGYAGGYDAVRRYAQRWRELQASATAVAFVPLSFAPGEAYQFDWSHEIVLLDGVTTEVKVAHMRLCHSRMPFVRAYLREAQEMVFDAHDRAFAFFKGQCTRGIYDNMKTAVDAIYVGQEARSAAGVTGKGIARKFNRRFEQMMSHYLVEPVACTPGAGWEKGQVENQVGNVRERLFVPRLRFKTLEDLNGWLLDECVRHAKEQKHPEFAERTVFEVFEAERGALIAYPGPFDAYRATPASVSKTCLVRFDNNKYSVMAKAVGRPVDIYAYADRVVLRQNGEIVGEHVRVFGRDKVEYEPWHYVPVLARKPGALRNGAPFKDWELPSALGRVRKRLKGVKDGDRQMVAILTAVLTDGLTAVEAACGEALEGATHSADVILNILARRSEPAAIGPVATPASLALTLAPRADCARYDGLRPPPLPPPPGPAALATALPVVGGVDGAL